MASVEKMLSITRLQNQASPRRGSMKRPQNRAKLEEVKWQEVFEKPSMWIDKRRTKERPEDPDFVHVFTWQGLQIDSSFCPRWVALKLQSLDDPMITQQSDSSNTFKANHERQAIEFIDKAREDGSPLSTPALLAGLKACSSLKDLDSGTRIHSYLLEKPELESLFVSTALVDMYTKCGEVVAARRVFERMVERDVVAWNTMIRGSSLAGEHQQALELFRRMQEQEGIQPDARTFVAALGACSRAAEKLKGENKLEYLARGRELHSQLVKMGVEQDVYIASSLVDMYSKCGSIVEARRVFESRRKQGGADVVLWTAIILGYAQSPGEARTALELFEEMQKDRGGVEPNARTYVAALGACSSLAREEQTPEIQSLCSETGKKIHDQLSQQGYEHDSFVASSLLDMYCSCRLMTEARKVFDKMPHKDVVSWTTILQGYSEAGEAKAALELYWGTQQESQEQRLKPNSKTLVAALNACSSMAAQKDSDSQMNNWCFQNGSGVHGQACRSGDESDKFVSSSLVNMYSKCGRLDRASRVFEAMVSPDMITFTALISGLAHTGDQSQAREALQLLHRMPTWDPLLLPNAATYAAALHACGTLASRQAGTPVLAAATRAGLESHAAVVCATVDWCGRCGDARGAELVFEGGDAATWSALIGAHARQGDAASALAALRRMAAIEVEPDKVTCISVLSACSHAGIVQEAIKVLEMIMGKKLGSLDGAHQSFGAELHGCLVDLLGRANRLEEAAEVATRVATRNADGWIVWLAVLDACRRWRNVEVARTAFQALMRLDAEVPAAYSLMAQVLVTR